MEWTEPRSHLFDSKQLSIIGVLNTNKGEKDTFDEALMIFDGAFNSNRPKLAKGITVNIQLKGSKGKFFPFLIKPIIALSIIEGDQ